MTEQQRVNAPSRTTRGDEQDEAIRARLERRIALSRAVLLWEALWPALVLPACVLLVFLAASWFGVWTALSETTRFWTLIGFAVALALALIPIARVEYPSRRAAVRRLDLSEGITNRPVGALSDRLPPTKDEATQALWRAHVAREMQRADAVRVERPHPAVSRRDPYQLRVALVLVALVGLVYAGPGAIERVTSAFRGAPPAVVIPPRIDAWVTPPAYTGRPPIFLAAERRSDEGPLRVPQGSVLTIRVDRGEDIDLAVAGTAVESESEVAALGTPRLFRATLTADAGATLTQNGRATREWTFVIEPDRVPTITLEGKVQQTPGGALRVRYKVEDDYGVATAFARIEQTTRPAASTARPTLALGTRPDARPLYGAPDFPLSLPQARPRSATGTTTRDLTSHPWAGARVTLTLVARDDASQEGTSAAVFIELPQRRFEQPLARAVVEQRRLLAMDATQRQAVATALDFLTLDPERRVPDTKVFLGLRTAYFRLLNARGDDQLRSVVDHLWDVALLIEDGDLSMAERALRDAQERLERALERGASEEEIRRLMEELRQALAQMMQEMMRQAERDRQQGRQMPPLTGNERMLTPQDFERLMREIEELARSGNRDAARNLMSQLRNMLEALRNARPTPQGRQGQQQDMLDELGNMIREQQRLMDQTFRERQQRQQQGRQGQQRGQQQDQRGQPGQRGQQGQRGQGEQEGQQGGGAMEGLRQGQQALRDQLQRFIDQLRQGGRDPGRSLGDAGDQMGQAEEQLGRGNPGDALGPQNRALDNLRRGAQQMAREMMGDGEGDPNGMPGDGTGNSGQAQRRPNMNDPLQRNLPPDDTLSSDVRVPDRADRQRIQEILEDVRRRLSDPNRPTLEMDYLQRLLRPF